MKIQCTSWFSHLLINKRRVLGKSNILLVLISVKRLSRPQGHSATGRIMSMKNSNDTNGNRSRNLPVCSTVPQTLRHRVPPIGGTSVYIREENASSVMVADRPYGKFCDFYSVSPEYFGMTPVRQQAGFSSNTNSSCHLHAV
jgi:hypothetical protein